MNKIMKKCYMLGVISIALEVNVCLGEFVAQDFISPRTGKSSVFWGDASKGKDAYVLEYDEVTDNYYFKKVEKNKPSTKKSKTPLTAEITPQNESKKINSKKTEKQVTESLTAINAVTKTAVNTHK